MPTKTPSSTTSNVILEVENLAFRHESGGERQVAGVSFALRAGRTFGVLGGNECGKTTLAHLVLGNVRPEKGTIRIFGRLQSVSSQPRWILPMRILLGICFTCTIALRFLAPPALRYVVMNRYCAWCLPVLLLLLEIAYQLHQRYSADAPASMEALETGMAPSAMLAGGVGYISSEHDAGQKLAAEMTIEECIGRFMPLPKASKDARRREVKAALSAAGFQLYKESGVPAGNVDEYLHDGLKCGELSGGQKHLIYVLSVLASRPSLLICDDCLCGLDIDRQSSMVAMLQRLQLHYGMAMLWLTVDLTSFTLMAHDGAFMKHGKFLESGPAADIATTPQRRDTQHYVQLSQENEERSRGKNLRQAYQKGESVFNL